MKYDFCVVTKIPDPKTDDGNLASAIVFGLPRELTAACLIHGRVEVFAKGEILILNEDGREICGHMRKPGKWDVETEHFETIEEAIKRSIEVSNE